MKYIFRWYAIDQSKHHRRRYWVLLCINSSLIAIKWSCKDGIDWSTCDIHIKDSFLLTFNALLSHKYLLKLCYRVVYIHQLIFVQHRMILYRGLLIWYDIRLCNVESNINRTSELHSYNRCGVIFIYVTITTEYRLQIVRPKI